MKPSLPFEQRQLAQHCYWDDEAQCLWVDCRQCLPQHGVFSVPSWDAMMLSSEPIADYPPELQLLNWSDFSQLAYWKKQIPKWVLESCALFPTHQLRLLHYVGRYPQLLELLDHSPMLAWRLVTSDLSEADIVSLLNDKRTQVVQELGWPGKSETVSFLRKLRLRYVNDEIAEFVDVCILDDQRLSALQSLPRVNSMALSLAARFPHLIGSTLHQSLAQMPCRPMQCRSLIAQLEDTYRAAEVLQLPDTEVVQIGQARYLVDVEKIYQAWCFSSPFLTDLTLSDKPTVLTELSQWQALSQRQQHYWLTEQAALQAGELELVAFEWQGETVAAVLNREAEEPLLRVRREENQLPTAEQLSQLHLWLAQN